MSLIWGQTLQSVRLYSHEQADHACGDDQADFDRAEPVIDAYVKAVTLLGGPGSGQRTKMVNQICIAGLVQGLAEGIDFARRTSSVARLNYTYIQ